MISLAGFFLPTIESAKMQRKTHCKPIRNFSTAFVQIYEIILLSLRIFLACRLAYLKTIRLSLKGGESNGLFLAYSTQCGNSLLTTDKICTTEEKHEAFTME